MDKTLASMFRDVGPEAPTKPKTALKEVMRAPKHDDIAEDLKSQVEALGVSADNIPLSKMGRELLVHRLRSEHGPQYQSDRTIQQLLAKFDSYLESYPDEVRKKDMSMHTGAERTLAMLRGFKDA